MKPFSFFSGMAWGPGLMNSLGGAGIGYYGLWFRVCGYGLHISTRKQGAALFSEREGYRKALYVFGIRVELLKP